MSAETDAPIPSTEIAAGTPSSLVEPKPAGQDGSHAEQALSGNASTASFTEPTDIPLPKTAAATKQSVSQKHPSNTFYRSCEISLMEPVGSMSISPANRDVVLAARKGLFIIDLEDPYAPPRFLAHMTTWEAVDIQWSPHPARSNWVASTSNQKLLIWNLDRPGDPRAASPISRMPLRNSVHSSSSPVASSNPHFTSHRAGIYQSVYHSHSAHSGATAGGTSGFGPISANSPFGQTPMSMASHFYTSSPRSSAIEHVLHAHTRAITDINWSPFHPEMVASSSIDTWTWVWDLRMSGTSDGSTRRKPAQGYSAWNAAVTQVKFNRASEHRLASTCDNKVLIWDDRKGSLPLATIEAHESKIYGIDWSRDTSLGLDRLVTCSLDRTVKFWNLASDTSQAAIGARELVTEAESMIETKTPVWRARHLPFGNGVMTLPQRGDTTLSMWAKDDPQEPKATFAGHTDIVKEYLFRTKGGRNRDCDDRQFQLITWSKDQTLRLWPVTEDQVRKVGHRPNEPIRVLLTRANAPDISYRDPPLGTLAHGEDDAALKSQGSASASNITVSSLLPPERATRSLLSGKGSGSKLNGGSPYGSSISGFQKDGRTSPMTAFSAGSRLADRSLNHSTSHGNLSAGLEALSRSPTDAFPRSLGRAEAGARSLPRQTENAAFSSRFATSHHSSKFGGTSQHSGNWSFKAPHNLKSGPMSGMKQRGQQTHGIRPVAIQEEQSSRERGFKKKSKEKDRRGGANELVTGKKKKHGREVVGAAMRLDRGRMTGPAVDPIEWIANVRMEKDDSNDTRQSENTLMFAAPRTDNRGSIRGFDSGRDMEGYNKDGPTTEDDTDAEPRLTSQRLGDEIVAINRKLPRIVFEKVELAQRNCVLTMYGPWADYEPAFLRIRLRFPSNYPRQPPKFDLEKSASITLKTRAYLLRGLARLSAKAAQLGRPCIEICARFLIGEPIKSLDEGEGEDEDEEDDVFTTSRGGGSAESSTQSEDDLPIFRPGRSASAPSKVKVRTKIPPRRMGASFGPGNELVVFGGSPQGVNSRTASQQTSRSASRTRDPGNLRSKSISAAARARSKSRARLATTTAEDVAIDSDSAKGAEEESRFLRSYTALSNAMASLAKYSKTAGEDVGRTASGGYGIRDSDVVQLMSTDFFARRLLQRKDFFDDFGSHGHFHVADKNAGKDAANAEAEKKRAGKTFYSGSGASTPGQGRVEDGVAEDGHEQDALNVLHHADLRGSLPAPAAIFALNRLREQRRRRAGNVVTIYQLVDLDSGVSGLPIASGGEQSSGTTYENQAETAN